MFNVIFLDDNRRQTSSFILSLGLKYPKQMDSGLLALHQETNIVNISGEQFEIADEFDYLGALKRADNDFTVEIKKRIMAANR